jgi:nucleotide-binding universal stress UspA family protein
MAYKDILVHVTDDEACAARVACAAELAVRFDAHLTGVFTTEPMRLNPMIENAAAGQIREVHDRQIGEARDAARKVFDSAAKRAGIAGEWAATEGDADEMIGLRALYADLVVVGQNDPDRTVARTVAHLPEHLVLNARRPTMVVPYAGKFDAAFGHAIVAWHPGPEAANAVAAAMPLLKAAKKVTVLMVDPVDMGGIPGADIAAHLARHGVKVDVQDVDTGAGADIQGSVFHGSISRRVAHAAADHMPVGEVLLSSVSSASADLLVMGGFGHSRLRETLFGGASAHILRHMTVPVLMAH